TGAHERDVVGDRGGRCRERDPELRELFFDGSGHAGLSLLLLGLASRAGHEVVRSIPDRWISVTCLRRSGVAVQAALVGRLREAGRIPMLRRSGRSGANLMTIPGKSVLSLTAVLAGAVAAAAAAGAFGARHAKAVTQAGELASHRAIYELTLAQGR